jgi:hypothetical protein
MSITFELTGIGLTSCSSIISGSSSNKLLHDKIPDPKTPNARVDHFHSSSTPSPAILLNGRKGLQRAILPPSSLITVDPLEEFYAEARELHEEQVNGCHHYNGVHADIFNSPVVTVW